MLSSFRSLFSNIRFADFLDMAIITVLLYFILTWVRKKASRSVIIGFSVVLALFGLARFLNMYMTSMMFHAGLTAAMMALVLVFQDDLRMAMERLSSLGSLQSKSSLKASNKTLESLIESVRSMAADKIGALIVLKGKDSLERHLSGGISLHGRISSSLLYSIFHPSTPNHDGAVIVEGERIDRFGVKLPLSLNLAEVGQSGTRHTAALGISERSDALVIVVSEERGSITLAHLGKLERVTALELQRKIETFYNSIFPPPARRKWYSSLLRDSGLKMAAASLSFLIWFLFAYKTDTVNRTFTVPVIYRNIPADWVIEEPKASEVKVTLAGPDRAFIFDPSALAVSVDMSHISEGRQTVIVSDKDINAPKGISVNQITPRTFSVSAQKTSLTEIPLKVRTTGKLPQNLILEEIRIQPSTLNLMLPKSKKAKLGAIGTESLDLSKIQQSTTVRLAIIAPTGIILSEEQASVKAFVTVKSRDTKK